MDSFFRSPFSFLTNLVLLSFFFPVYFSFATAQENFIKKGNKPHIFGDGKDYFSLGPLGAKGLPAKTGFLIKQLETGGLAANAGLKVNDIILQANEEILADSKNCWYLLGEEIEKAESHLAPTPTELVLQIKRKAEEEIFTLNLPRVKPHEKSCPYQCEACQKLAQNALKALAKFQQADGSLPTELAATNGICVVSSIGLMAFIAAGELEKESNHQLVVKKLLNYLKKNTGKDPIDKLVKRSKAKENWNQTNWAWSFAGISTSLFYKAKKNQTAKSLAYKASSKLIKNQKKTSGGWGHGPGGNNALGYNELFIVTGLALNAISLSQQNGKRISPKIIKRALAYLDLCITKQGGIGYGIHNMMWSDTGRTAIGILALSALDLKADERFQKLSSWFINNTDKINKAHQGYLFHFLFSALAARELGKEAFQKFWKRYRIEILLARNGSKKGLFTTRPTGESIRNRSSIDIALGEAWATAVYAIILQLADGQLPLFSSEKKSKK